MDLAAQVRKPEGVQGRDGDVISAGRDIAKGEGVGETVDVLMLSRSRGVDLQGAARKARFGRDARFSVSGLTRWRST